MQLCCVFIPTLYVIGNIYYLVLHEQSVSLHDYYKRYTVEALLIAQTIHLRLLYIINSQIQLANQGFFQYRSFLLIKLCRSNILNS